MTLAVAFTHKRRRYLAADRCLIASHELLLVRSKIWCPYPGVAMTFAGDASLYVKLVRKAQIPELVLPEQVDELWVSAHLIEPLISEDEKAEGDILVVTQYRTILGDTSGFVAELTQPFSAIGAGASYARGFYSRSRLTDPERFCTSLFREISREVAGVSEEFQLLDLSGQCSKP